MMSDLTPALLVETPWEERNLGVKSFLLNAECLSTLSQQQLDKAFADLKHRYRQFFVFCRLSNARLDLVPCLQGCGFYLVEGAVCPVIQLDKSSKIQEFSSRPDHFIPARFKDHDIQFSTLGGENERQDKILMAIARESFSSDRFHMDYRCPKKTANRRFELWIRDLLNNGRVTFDIIRVNEEIAGFMAREGNHLLIAGLSRKYGRAGLGDFLWLGSLRKMQEHGLRYAETLVSINNIPSLNLHARLGFKFRNPQYSFHYWHE